MNVYHYKALDANGKKKRGLLTADSAKEVRKQLRHQGLFPMAVTAEKAKAQEQQRTTSIRRIKVVDLSLLTRQLSTLLNAALPLAEALKVVAEQTEKAKIKAMMLSLRADVSEGQSFAQALGRYPRVFSNIYRAAVSAGEHSGHLDLILERLADHAERQHEVRQKVLQALVYPALVTTISILIVTFLLIFVVPKMLTVFTSMHQSLPLVTQILLAISHGVRAYGIYIFLLALLLFGFYQWLLKKKSVSEWRDKVLLRLPFYGYLIKISSTGRYISSLGMLIAASVPLLEAMRMAAELIANQPIRQALYKASMDVREGGAVHRALQQTRYFQPMSAHLIASGEASGQLTAAMDRVATNQERELNRLIDMMITLFEPMMILIMGSVVLFIVLAVLLPVFSMNDLVNLS